MGKLRAFKQKIADGLLVFADGAGFLFSAFGASFAAFLGKVMLAVAVGAIALGFFLRLAARRKVAEFAPLRTPTWGHFLSAAFAFIETAALVEATNLPVRFHQPGFAPWHWLLVVGAFLVAYLLQVRVVRTLAGRQRALRNL